MKAKNRRVTYLWLSDWGPFPKLFLRIKSKEKKSFAACKPRLRHVHGLAALINSLTQWKVPRQGSKQPLAFLTIPQSFVKFYFTMAGYIFGIDCQTTFQVQEKRMSRLPVKIYVQLRCSCCGRVHWASCPDTGQHRSSAKILILRWKQRQKS